MKTSQVWRSRTAALHLFVMCYITTLMLLFSQLQLAHASRTMSSKNHPLQSEVIPSTREEVEADFLSWVAFVGAKSKSTTSSPTLITRLPSEMKDVTQVYYVDVAGFGNFRTVQEAVNAVPEDNTMQVLIVVKPGTYRYCSVPNQKNVNWTENKKKSLVYGPLPCDEFRIHLECFFLDLCREKVTIPKSKGYITLQGAGRNVTCIEYDMNAATAGSTYDSATVAVFSDYFVAKDISFKVPYTYRSLTSRFFYPFTLTLSFLPT